MGGIGKTTLWVAAVAAARASLRVLTARPAPAERDLAYAGLGDPRWKGKLCLRSGTSEYNISFVADRIAKDGTAKTKAMLERWMANDPTILGSDTDVLKSISGGACDVGFTNSYYLGRELEEPLQLGARVLRPVALVAVREQ